MTVTLPALLSLVLGTVIPGLTALITRENASPRVKAFLTALLAAVTGALSTAVSSPPAGAAGWEQLGVTVLLSWISAAAAYFFGWKPTGASDALSRRSAAFGAGTPSLSETLVVIGAALALVAGLAFAVDRITSSTTHVSSFGVPLTTTTTSVPPARHAPGVWYVTGEPNPGQILYEGSYQGAQDYATSHVGSFQTAPLNSPLSKGHKRCNPAKAVCLVP